MPHPLEAGTIRILKPDGSTAGTGFLVSKHLAITCAHVAESAGSEPGALLSFKYHLGDWAVQQAKILENGWSAENDTAILELVEQSPRWIRALLIRFSLVLPAKYLIECTT